MDHIGAETRRLGGHQETADTVIGLRPDSGDVSEVAVGDPHLGAVDHPVGTITSGTGAHTGRVGAEVGLGQSEATDGITSGQSRQPLMLLFLGPVAVDRVHRQ